MQNCFYSWLAGSAPASEAHECFSGCKLTRGPGVAVDKKTNDSGGNNRTIPLIIEK